MADVGDHWRIEKSLLIKAPIEMVWAQVAEPNRLSRWWCPPPTVEIEFEPVVGGAYEERYSDGSYDYVISGEVTVFEKPNRFGVRRRTSGRFGPTDLVEIGLAKSGDHTRVSVNHMFDEILPERRGEAQDFFADGWAFSLGLLEKEVLRSLREA